MMRTGFATMRGDGGDMTRAAATMVAVVVAIAAFFAYLGARDQGAEPTGFDALAPWLAENGIDVARYDGVGPPPEEVGLRVLTPERFAALTRREALWRQRTTKTLVMPAKWAPVDGGTLVAEAASAPWPDDKLPVVIGGVDQAGPGFTTHEVEGSDMKATLWAARTFSAPTCAPLVGKPGAIVLGACPWRNDSTVSVMVLADPGLFSNHGLALGDNAALAPFLMRRMAGDGPVVIDEARQTWPARDSDATRAPRDLSMLAEWPLSLIWAGVGLTTLLAVWRGAVRFGGPVPLYADDLSAARKDALVAAARLMRMTGANGRLAGVYASERAAAVADRLSGGAGGDHWAALEARAARRSPEVRAEFSAARAAIAGLDRDAAPEAARRAIERFETVLKRITDDA